MEAEHRELQYVQKEITTLKTCISQLGDSLAKKTRILTEMQEREQRLKDDLGLVEQPPKEPEKKPANPDHPLRVYEVAKQHGVKSKEVLTKLAAIGVDISELNHLSVVKKDDAKRAFKEA